MRRIATTLVLVALSLTLVPARADAYFWAWLDDLSGPRYMWLPIAEVQVVCTYTSAANDPQALWLLDAELREETARFKYEAAADIPARTYFLEAVAHIEAARAQIKDAMQALTRPERPDVTSIVVKGLHRREQALHAFEQGWRFKRTGTDPRKERGARAESTYFDADGSVPRRERIGFLGASFSVCPATTLDRDKHYLKVNLAYGWDAKDRNEGQGNKVWSVGASYHYVLTPYFTAGTGIGVSRFSFRGDQPTFHKLYLQPVIFDFRPVGLVTNSTLRSPWWHVPFLRYSNMFYPAGFEAGSFAGQTSRYRQELVQSVGVYADFAPLLRKRHKRW